MTAISKVVFMSPRRQFSISSSLSSSLSFSRYISSLTPNPLCRSNRLISFALKKMNCTRKEAHITCTISSNGRSSLNVLHLP